MPKSKGRRPKSTPKALPFPKLRKDHSRPAAVLLGGILGGIVAKTWKIAVALSVIATILATAVYFLPRVTVDLGELLDSSDLLSVRIAVKNDGVVTLNDVSVGMGLCRMVVRCKGAPCNFLGECGPRGKSRSILTLNEWVHHRLLPGEGMSVSLVDLARAHRITPVESADITISVSYRPWFIPFGLRESQFRIVGGRNLTGRYEWRLVPLDEK